jgi:hypothetical protein
MKDPKVSENILLVPKFVSPFSDSSTCAWFLTHFLYRFAHSWSSSRIILKCW